MAFCPPAVSAAAWAASGASTSRTPHNVDVGTAREDQQREWVLFSPLVQEAPSESSSQRAASGASGSHHSVRSGFSELELFQGENASTSASANNINNNDDDNNNNNNNDNNNNNNNNADLPDIVEDDELDSLDDGLPEFHEPMRRVDQSGGSILPAHDGVGIFSTADTPLLPLQGSVAHEEGRQSRLLDGGLVREDEGTGSLLDQTRKERIEIWRTEQSRLMLEEMIEASKAFQSGVPDVARSPDATDRPRVGQRQDDGGDETFWERMARRLLHDVIGLDDSLLCVVFGESLIDDDMFSSSSLSSSPKTAVGLAAQRSRGSRSGDWEDWEGTLLHRVAQELKNLAELLSTHPELPVLETVQEYAGIPLGTYSAPRGTSRSDHLSTRTSTDEPQFNPTLQHQHQQHQTTTGLEPEVDETTASGPPPLRDPESLYWEQPLDIKSVFSYLSRRFLSRHWSGPVLAPDVPRTQPKPSSCTPDSSQRRAAMIRQYHPLISRLDASVNAATTSAAATAAAAAAAAVPAASAASVRRDRPSSLRRHASLGLRGSVLSPSIKRTGTSCASHNSTKKSRREAVASDGAGSRHYWDIGSSVTSGSVMVGGMGSWGDI